jgi:hypothetical protein
VRSNADVPLRETQKNQVGVLVRRAGFDLGEFKWRVVPVGGHTVDELVHESTGYQFAFDIIPPSGLPYGIREEDRASYFSPGPEHVRQRANSYGWDAQLEVVEVWLEALKEEVGTVSIWDTFGRQLTRELAEADLSNRPMTGEELKEFAAGVAQVRGFIRANVGDPERLRRVEEKVDELLDAGNRLGLRDLASFSLGTMMTIAVTAAFSPDQAQHLVNLFFVGVRVLLGQ